MAADIRTRMISEHSRKRQRLSHVPKLLPNEQVEVRSVEEGFLGSWHLGTVIELKTQIRVVKYEHLLCEDSSDNLVEFVPVLFAVDGKIPADWRPSDFPNYRGKIRPVPPQFIHDETCLHYGQCVDAYYQDAWWEGVIFDHNDGSEERLVFFPDMGDELRVSFRNLRFTQDWDAASDEWKVRGDWVFLEVIEELKLEWPLFVSVKQIWYEVRTKKCFVKEMKEWTCPVKESWKETVKEVMEDNFKLTMVEFFDRLNFSEDLDVKKCLPEPSPFVEEEFLDDFDSGPPGSSNLPSNPDAILSTKPDYEDLSPSWSEAVDPFREAKCCPDAIVKYYKYFKSGKKPPIAIALKVRQHLSYLGWKIESKIFRIGLKGNACFRYRYTDPKGNYYYSLNVLCTILNQDSSESTSSGSSDAQINLETQISSTPTKEEPTLELPMVEPESEYCPHAVVEYYSLTSEKSYDGWRKRDDEFIKMKIRAKKHLFAVGWSDLYVEYYSGRKSIVYKSPSGRKFYSLRQACNHYIVGSLCCGFDNTSKTNVGELVKMGKHEAFGKVSIKKKKGKMLKQDNKSLKKSRNGSKDESLTKTCVLRLRKSVRKEVSSMYQAPRTVLSLLIDNNIILPRAKVQYRCKKDGLMMREGRVARDGIKCSCCQSTFSLSKFQSHAGSTYGRPSANIFLEDGRSLLDCQLQLKLDQNARLSRTKPRCLKGNRLELENDNDYICSVCQYGGELVLCDQCPASFHTSCLGLEEVPDGEWFCPSCCCRICNQNKFIESYEQSTDSNILNCEQCEKRYHIGCLKKRGLLKLESCHEVNWFCSLRCEEIFTGLHKLLGKSIPVGRGNLTWTLLKHQKTECSNYEALHMKELAENYSKLNVAISVMHECFEPVKDARTGRDIVEDVIFCRWSELPRLNFKGFYTILLEKDDELISTATIRVYGEKVAELPFVGTRFQYRRRGMCHILMHELEKKLTELGVERLVLPAVSSVLHTWTRSFGFSMMTESEKSEFLGCTFLDFQGTRMCHKLLVMGLPFTEPSISRGKSYDANIDLDGISASAVSEVSQAERMEESGIVEESSSEHNGGTTPLEIMMNQSTHIERESETSVQCSTQASNPREGKNNANTGVLKCYQRRKFTPVRVDPSFQK